MKEIIYNIKEFLVLPLTRIGTTEPTLCHVVYFVILISLLVYLTVKIRKRVVYSLLAKSKIDLRVKIAVGTVLRNIEMPFQQRDLHIKNEELK
jgi:hypothetical protein